MSSTGIFFIGNVINTNEDPVAIETCLGWVLSGRAIPDYINNNAVQNVFKILTAQIDTTPDSIEENDKSLIELIESFLKIEDIGIHVEQDSLIKTSKISLDIRSSNIPLNSLAKVNIRTFLIISYQQGISCFLY